MQITNWTGINRVLLICLLFSKGLLAQKVHTAQSFTDTTAVYKLIQVADDHQAKNRFDSAAAYYKKAGKLARELGFYNGLMLYTGKYTGLLYRNTQYKEALKIAGEQLEISQNAGDKLKEAQAYNNIALQQEALGNLEDAAQNLIKAISVSQQLKDSVNLKKYYTNLASVFINIKDFPKAINYAKQSHAIAQAMNDSAGIGRSLVNLLVAEVLNNELDKAEDHAREAIKFGNLLNDMDLMLTGYVNLGEIALKQKKYSGGLTIYKTAYTLLPQAPPGYDAYVLYGLAASYWHSGMYQQANSFFDRCIKPAEEQLPKAELKDVYRLGADIKEQIGQYKAALAFQKKFSELNEKVTSEATQTAIQRMEIQYQTAQKEQAIAQQQLQIIGHQNELERKNKWIAWGAFVLVLFVSVAALGYLIMRQRAVSQKEVQRALLLQAKLKGEEAERAKTARELHDGVAGILTAAIMHINSNASMRNLAPAKKIAQLIETAVQEIRNLSHNLAPEMVLNEGLPYAVNEFCNRMSNDQLQINFYAIGEIPRLQDEFELLLYRIIQEAVTNMLKHSGASEGMVQLQYDEDRLSITIEDDGQGFDPAVLRLKGIGLTNLLERVRLLNGEHEIISEPGKGTTVYITLNLQKHMYRTVSDMLPAFA